MKTTNRTKEITFGKQGSNDRVILQDRSKWESNQPKTGFTGLIHDVKRKWFTLTH